MKSRAPGNLGWLTQLAATLCGASMAALVRVEEEGERVVATHGIAAAQSEGLAAVCLAEPPQDGMVVIHDASADERLAAHPLVRGVGLRFYAGVPLHSADGSRWGALVVLDTEVRWLDERQRRSLLQLAVQSSRLWTDAASPVRLDAAASLRLDAEMGAVILRIQQEAAQLDLRKGFVPMAILMIERVRELIGAEGGDIDLLEGGDLVCVATSGMVLRPVGFRRRLDAHDTGMARAAVREGRTQVTGDAVHDPRLDNELQRRNGIGSLAVAPLRAPEGVIGVLRMRSSRRHAFTERHVLSMGILAESIGSLLQQHRLAAQWRASEEQYRLLFDSNPHPMVLTDIGHHIIAVNEAAVAHYGYDRAEFLSMHVSALWPPQDEPVWRERLKDFDEDRVVGVMRRHRRKDGSVMDVEVSCSAVEVDGQPAHIAMFVDVTQRLRAERLLARANRAHRMLSASNELQVRTTDEQALLAGVCRIVMEIGGYSLAWVGFALDDDDRSIVPVASASANEASDFLRDLGLTWSEQGVVGRRRPAHQVIYSGEIAVIEDVRELHSQEPWAVRLLERGYLGVVCLPLRDARQTYGVLCLNSQEPVYLGQDEAKLLRQLADDLAFGIGNLRAQAEQRALQTAVLRVAEAVSAASGTEFFEQLVRNTVETLGAQAGALARWPADGTPAARTVAAVAQGSLVPNFSFALADSPCASAPRLDHGAQSGSDVLRFAQPLLGAELQEAHCIWRRLDNSAGRPVGLILVLFGVSLRPTELMASTLRIFAARAAAEIERQEADARIRDQASLLDKAQDAIVVRNLEDRVLFWNRSAERLYGWTDEEVLGKPLAPLLDDDAGAYQRASRHVLAQGEWQGEFSHRRKDGNHVTVEARWTLVRDEHGYPHSIFAINTDITQRKATELQIQKLAYYDPLTALPNRILLMDRLQHALDASQHSGQGGALLCIDLDNFKTLNESLGHDRGDLLLQQVAQRLLDQVGERDTVARLGGDEFMVMLEQIGTDLVEVARRSRVMGEEILAALTTPFDLEGYEHRGTCSIGIAPFFAQQESVGELLKHVDVAMYEAKTAGRNTLRFFNPDMQEAVTARALMESDMRQALTQQEFLLYYQPQVDAEGRVLGVEALLRWKHPQRGLVSPALFIPLAEETGLILPVGRWVLETACTLLAEWSRRAETAHLTIAVNVSALQFRNSDFVDDVLMVLDRTGAPADRLKLELTESLLASDVDAIIAKMGALKARGVCFSLDDFGTGYSSLFYLKRLPLDQLKIDQSFVRDILTDPNDAAIVRTIITLARSLGQDVIAEGVETDAQRQFLASHDCLAYQGYLFSRPLPVEQLMQFLEGRVKKAA